MDDLIARMAHALKEITGRHVLGMNIGVADVDEVKALLAEFDAHRATADGGKDAVWGYIRHRDIARLTKDADLGGWCPEIVATPDETFDTPLYAAPPTSGHLGKSGDGVDQLSRPDGEVSGYDLEDEDD